MQYTETFRALSFAAGTCRCLAAGTCPVAGGGGLQFVDFTPSALVLDAVLFGDGHNSAIIVVGQKELHKTFDNKLDPKSCKKSEYLIQLLLLCRVFDISLS